MATSKHIQNQIQRLQKRYITLKKGKDALLRLIDEAEISEAVYNSNAIENSTLTLKETEKILLEMELSRDVDLREVFEAKNLARITEYIAAKEHNQPLTEEFILLLHQMLLTNIDDTIAGRFRAPGEYVRVGTHIAPAPEQIDQLLNETILAHTTNIDTYFLDAIARFHLEFETIHPFNDGNGRIGRVLINYQLQQIHLPNIIIRDKEKHLYYQAFRAYNDSNNTKLMEKIFALALTEALHKRIAYLEGAKIIRLADYAKQQTTSAAVLINAARRQTIPGFREKGVWKIDTSYTLPTKK